MQQAVALQFKKKKIRENFFGIKALSENVKSHFLIDDEEFFKDLKSKLNPSRPNPGRREKIKLKLLFIFKEV